MNKIEIDPALDTTLDAVTRRRFLQKTGAAAAVVALAASGAEAAPPGLTEKALADTSIHREDITFPVGNEQIKGHLAHAKTGGKRGSVIIIHEIFGVSDHIKSIAARLAEAGYDALAVNFFTREGEPPPLSGGFGPLMEFVGKIPDAQVLGDVSGAAKYLSGLPTSNGRVGVVGFCWGGGYAMLSAAEAAPLNAAVAYYGRIRLPEGTDRAIKPHSPFELAAQMKVPLLGHFGELDNGIPKADADALRDALQAAHKPGEIYVYSGANHAFNNDTRESFNPQAAALAWSRTLAWFGKYLKG